MSLIKLEHGFRRISARIPNTLPEGHEDNDVPTFWLLLYSPKLLQNYIYISTYIIYIIYIYVSQSPVRIVGALVAQGRDFVCSGPYF